MSLEKNERESEVSFILLKTKCRANIKSWMSKTIKLKSTNSSYTVFLSCTQLWGKTSSFFFVCQSSSRFSVAWLSGVFFLSSLTRGSKITCKTRHIANTIKQIPWVFPLSPLITDHLHTQWPYARNLQYSTVQVNQHSRVEIGSPLSLLHFEDKQRDLQNDSLKKGNTQIS